ncbi:MAG: hypothetical protein JNL79_05915 [Myxococcales bacterium]|nr:hypothetical protein [Myxococcales bacterium]
MRRPHRARPTSRDLLRRGLASGLTLGALFAASPGQAMPPYDPEWPPPAATVPAGPPTPSMASLFGFQGLQQAARSPNAETRAAAVLRAAELAKQKDTPTALGDDCWKLVESAANDAWGDDPDAALRVRLTAARALVDDRRAADARRALRDLFLTPGLAAAMMKGPFVVGAAPRTKLASPELVRLVRQTAAMALAILGDDDTLLTKVKDPEASPAAIAALAAHAPVTLVALLPKSDSIPANDVIDALGKLGDLRAADALERAFEKSHSPRALVALARLGDPRAATHARLVLATDPESLRLAAAEALSELGETDSEARILALLSAPVPSAAARALAVRFPGPSLVPALEAAAKGGSDAATAALARAGAPGVAALATLVKDDAHPDVADAAAFALATVPGSAASSALSALVAEPSPARVRRAVRASVSRLARLGTVPSGISSAAKELRAAKDAEGRFLAALLPAVSSLSDAKDAVVDADPLVRRAGITALHAHPAADAAPVARKAIPLESDPELLRGLVSVAARGIDGTVAHDVPIPTSQLAVWLGEDPGPSAAVAAFVLGARGGPSANGHVARALEADDLSVRAAALLGLGLSADPGATQRLVARLLEPMAVEARRVAARALASRSDPAAATALAMVSQLDADAEVRATARRKGPRISPLLSGTEVGQTKVVGAGTAVLVRPTMQRADGFPLALLPDPDGFVLAFRLPPGETRFTLHATSAPPSAPAPKTPVAPPKAKP